MSKSVSNLTKQIINLLERSIKTAVICKTLRCKPAQVYQIKYNYKAEIKKARVATKKAAKFVSPSNTPPLVSPEIPAPKTTDYVNNPPHYTKGGIEVIDFIEAKGFGYNLGNVVKYVSRVDLKTNTLEDLQKAEWYLKREIAKRRGKEYYHKAK